MQQVGNFSPVTKMVAEILPTLAGADGGRIAHNERVKRLSAQTPRVQRMPRGAVKGPSRANVVKSVPNWHIFRDRQGHWQKPLPHATPRNPTWGCEALSISFCAHAPRVPHAHHVGLAHYTPTRPHQPTPL